VHKKDLLCFAFMLFAVTARFVWPETSHNIKDQMVEMICRQSDYRYMLTVIGRSAAHGRVKEELVEVLARGIGYDKEDAGLVDVFETDVEEQFPTPEPIDTLKPKDETVSYDEIEENTGTEEILPLNRIEQDITVPEAVSAFLEKEAAYEGYSIPDNVRTDMPDLPFDYICPVSGPDSSGFGFRLHPIKNEVCFHYGTDFAAESGAAIHAFADAYVYAAGTSESYGNYYILTHDGGFATLYAHLSEFVALEGEMVKKGQLIGRVGQTGNTTGPHLHFELLMDDMYLNPEYYL